MADGRGQMVAMAQLTTGWCAAGDGLVRGRGVADRRTAGGYGWDGDRMGNASRCPAVVQQAPIDDVDPGHAVVRVTARDVLPRSREVLWSATGNSSWIA